VAQGEGPELKPSTTKKKKERKKDRKETQASVLTATKS
jgi:hypothetical protein